jgi:RNA polymerase sigma factor (sigma-70 family)
MNRLRGASRGAFFNQLDRLFGQGTTVGSSEGELLERFVTGHDEVAFEALVARHGPMVLGVCRQLLRDPNDVDDAFQATFLVLVRKAGTLRRCDLLGNWLYGVAYRVAARVRALSARRNSRLGSGQESVESLAALECRHEVGLDQSMRLEQGPWLHQEVSHLPEKYRAPIVLCYFEGLTHDEAASRLGWPLGTVKGRLSRARDLLRRRLTRRGVALSATAMGSHLAALEAKAAVPASLRLTTLKAAYALACQAGASLAKSSAVSLPVSALVEGVLHTMIANQIKSFALTSLLVVGTVSTGVIVGASQLSGGSANTGKGDQIPAASTDSGRFKVPGTGAQAAVPQAGGATQSVSSQLAQQLSGRSANPLGGNWEPPRSPQLAQQLSVARTTFDQLVARERDTADIRRLGEWSLITLDADKVLGNSDADHVAAYGAHRDRMKKLHDFTQKTSPSDKHDADYTRNKLEEAEKWLEDLRHSRHWVRMPKGRLRGFGPIDLRGGSGQVGPVAAESLPSKLTATDAQKPEAKGADTEKVAPTEKASEKREQPKQRQALAGTGGMGGGMGSMGGGMGGMGGGMGGMGGGMGGMGGGMGGMGGGMMAGMSPEAINRGLRWSNAALAAEVASRDTEPKSKATFKKLDEPISMSFSSDTALEDVLKYIKQATSAPNSNGIPIYVDPKGLKDAEATLQSPIRLDLEGVPLKTTLRLMLKQIGLAYCVRDGVLIISSVQGINEELREAKNEMEANDPQEAGAGGFGGGGGGRNMGGMM